MLHCEHAKWMFNKDNIRYEHEFTLTLVQESINNKIINKTIDFWFIDNKNNVIIIDFKLSEPDNKSIKDFIDNQTNIYKTQLIGYKKILSDYLNIPENKIKSYLYFPLINKLSDNIR